MKISFSNLVDLTNVSNDDDFSKMNQGEKSNIDLGMNVGITSWPGITLEVSEHYYNVFW